MVATPRTLLHNWRLKVTALGLAIFLWALVQAEPRNAEIFAPVPVVVDVADTAWALSGSPDPGNVELRISGTAREMVRLARMGTVIRVPVGAVGSPDTSIVLRRDWVELGAGSGLLVESVSPASVRLAFEPAVNRVVPLAVHTVGALPPTLSLASPIGLNPPVARIRGPASRVDGIDSVHLRVLDLSTVEASGILELAVDTAGLAGVRVAPGVATVGIRVEERVERIVSDILVIAQPPFNAADLTIDPARVEVMLRGARTLVAAVDPLDLRAWVAPERLEGMEPGEERRVPVRLEGVPELLVGVIPLDMVTVRRRVGAPGSEERP